MIIIKGEAMTLDKWLLLISEWHKRKQYKETIALETLLFTAPDSIWGPKLTDSQSKAIACWLDACLRLYQASKEHNSIKAYQMLQYACAHLEVTAFNPITEVEIQDWCLKRLQHLTVLRLEFCNQQQDQSIWNKEAHSLIDIHVKLMENISWNEPYTNLHHTSSIKH